MEELTKRKVDRVSYKVIGAAIEVHKTLGPGLPEHVYSKAMVVELKKKKLEFKGEMKIAVPYKEIETIADFRCDFYVEECLVVELKSVRSPLKIFEGQLMTYMNLLECPKGVIINFHCDNIWREGQKTYVTKKYRELPAE